MTSRGAGKGLLLQTPGERFWEDIFRKIPLQAGTPSPTSLWENAFLSFPFLQQWRFWQESEGIRRALIPQTWQLIEYDLIFPGRKEQKEAVRTVRKGVCVSSDWKQSHRATMQHACAHATSEARNDFLWLVQGSLVLLQPCDGHVSGGWEGRRAGREETERAMKREREL